MAHHPDCDAWRTAHRTETRRIGAWGIEVWCDECGKLHAGTFGKDAGITHLFSDHSSEVPCDGRCKTWEKN